MLKFIITDRQTDGQTTMSYTTSTHYNLYLRPHIYEKIFAVATSSGKGKLSFRQRQQQLPKCQQISE